MKKTLILLALSFLLTNAFAQISVGTATKSKVIGEISKGAQIIKCIKIDNTYVFIFTNAKYQHITDMVEFSFEDIDNAFDNLYLIMKDDLQSPPEDCKRVINLPNGTLNIEYSNCRKGMLKGWFNFNLHLDDEPYAYTSFLNGKHLYKLFGKNKE